MVSSAVKLASTRLCSFLVWFLAVFSVFRLSSSAEHRSSSTANRANCSYTQRQLQSPYISGGTIQFRSCFTHFCFSARCQKLPCASGWDASGHANISQYLMTWKCEQLCRLCSTGCPKGSNVAHCEPVSLWVFPVFYDFSVTHHFWSLCLAKSTCCRKRPNQPPLQYRFLLAPNTSYEIGG